MENVYEVLITRHLARVEKLFPVKIDAILRDAGITFDGKAIADRTGRSIDSDTSFRYKESLRKHVGSGVHAMAVVNFKMGGCICQQCNEST